MTCVPIKTSCVNKLLELEEEPPAPTVRTGPRLRVLPRRELPPLKEEPDTYIVLQAVNHIHMFTHKAGSIKSGTIRTTGPLSFEDDDEEVPFHTHTVRYDGRTYDVVSDHTHEVVPLKDFALAMDMDEEMLMKIFHST